MTFILFFLFLSLVLLCLTIYLFARANKYIHSFLDLMLIIVGSIIILFSICMLFFAIYFFFLVKLYIMNIVDFFWSNMFFMNGPPAGTTSAVYLSNVNQEPVWIDLKIVNRQGDFYLVDSTQRSGANLLAQIQAESSQVATANLERIHIGYGLKVNFDTSNVLQVKTIEGTVYKGYYCDVGFNNASLTSGNLPLQKNEDGHTFIVWKKFTGGLRW